MVSKTSVSFLPLDLATSTGRYLINKGRKLRSLNPRSLFILTEVRQGVEVAKARLAAKPIVAKPNVDCIAAGPSEAETVSGFQSYSEIIYH